MRKKVLLGILLLSVLSFTTACNNNPKDISSSAPTIEPTNSPLPTADISINEYADGKNKLNNDTAGYKVSYDTKKLKMSNTGSSISFAPSNKKDKEELNLFLNITEVNEDAAKELGKQLKKTYKGSIKTKETTIGSSKASADCYTITDNKKIIHSVYILSSDKKSWYIELKCPSKYKKEYMTAFDEILDSMEF